MSHLPVDYFTIPTVGNLTWRTLSTAEIDLFSDALDGSSCRHTAQICGTKYLRIELPYLVMFTQLRIEAGSKQPTMSGMSAGVILRNSYSMGQVSKESS
ncbi:MAG: hypothetical protein ACI9ON_000456 [Limisphaerales bacterium]|jgi:hypothetical protein